MPLDNLDEIIPGQERKYLEFLLWHYRVLDAFWFLKTEEVEGKPKAEHMNELVWAECARLGARRIVKDFDIQEKGLAGFVKAYKLFPWSMLLDYDIQENENEIIIQVANCPPQEARLKRGLGEYKCKCMHFQEFLNFAKEIDPDIQVECEFAPPDPHPEHLFCRWRFYLSSSI